MTDIDTSPEAVRLLARSSEELFQFLTAATLRALSARLAEAETERVRLREALRAELDRRAKDEIIRSAPC